MQRSTHNKYKHSFHPLCLSQPRSDIRRGTLSCLAFMPGSVLWLPQAQVGVRLTMAVSARNNSVLCTTRQEKGFNTRLLTLGRKSASKGREGRIGRGCGSGERKLLKNSFFCLVRIRLKQHKKSSISCDHSKPLLCQSTMASAIFLEAFFPIYVT